MLMQEGDQFVDFKAFKAAMQDWSVAGAHKFNFRYKNSDSLRNIVVCAHDDCPFRVRATHIPTRQCVVVASVGESIIALVQVKLATVLLRSRHGYSIEVLLEWASLSWAYFSE